jgi:hypothetical protein
MTQNRINSESQRPYTHKPSILYIAAIVASCVCLLIGCVPGAIGLAAVAVLVLIRNEVKGALTKARALPIPSRETRLDP